MKSYYLHLRVFPCDICQGPVVTGSTAVRESDIQQETEITQVGAICRHAAGGKARQLRPTGRVTFPVMWDPPKAPHMGYTANRYFEMLSREEQH
jgi:hypothetical protein